MRIATIRPWDLYAAAAVSVLTPIVALALPLPPLRIALGLVFVLFFPGYALVAALFPERARVRRNADGTETTEGIGGLERIALSLGLSIAVVPLLGLLLNYSPWGIRLVPILTTVGGFTLVMSGIAYLRRVSLPEMARLQFRVHLDAPAWGTYTPLERVLTLALALAVVGASGALAYVAATPRASEAFTEFYILGPGGKAESYPTTLAAGDSGGLIVGIVNHEGRSASYRAEIAWISGDRAEPGNASSRFIERERVVTDTYNLTLYEGGKDERNLTVAAPTTPGTYRLEFDLFLDDGEAPYRELHLWVEVVAPPASESGGVK